mgnify:CR=1 FL=1
MFMARPKTLKNQKRVSVVLEEAHLARIQKAARLQSMEENKTITTSEIIRRALELAFPGEGAQLEFF